MSGEAESLLYGITATHALPPRLATAFELKTQHFAQAILGHLVYFNAALFDARWSQKEKTKGLEG